MNKSDEENNDLKDIMAPLSQSMLTKSGWHGSAYRDYTQNTHKKRDRLGFLSYGRPERMSST